METKRDDLEITEVGEIFFFYRPKVDVETPHSVDEVQRLYMVMRPVSADKNVEVKQDSHSEKVKEQAGEKQQEVGDGNKEVEEIKGVVDVREKEGSGKKDAAGGRTQEAGKEMDAKTAEELREEIKKEPLGEQGLEEVDLVHQALMRLVVVGRKVLPDPSKKARPTWCFVELVTCSADAMKEALSAVEYETKTRGHRVQPGARPAAEGVYCILRHKERQKHTHLVYKLDKHHEEHGDGPQEALHIENEASYIISVKNPQTSAPANAGLGNKRKATFPAKLQGLMGSYRFVAVHPPDYLNYEGCELILVPASDDVSKELDMELDADDYDAKLCADLGRIADMNSEVVRKPLFQGEWR